MKINRPERWRKGQTLFNFLEWLLTQGLPANQAGSRAADTFHISDKEFNKLWDKYEKELLKGGYKLYEN